MNEVKEAFLSDGFGDGRLGEDKRRGDSPERLFPINRGNSLKDELKLITQNYKPSAFTALRGVSLSCGGLTAYLACKLSLRGGKKERHHLA